MKWLGGSKSSIVLSTYSSELEYRPRWNSSVKIVYDDSNILLTSTPPPTDAATATCDRENRPHAHSENGSHTLAPATSTDIEEYEVTRSSSSSKSTSLDSKFSASNVSMSNSELEFRPRWNSSSKIVYDDANVLLISSEVSSSPHPKRRNSLGSQPSSYSDCLGSLDGSLGSSTLSTLPWPKFPRRKSFTSLSSVMSSSFSSHTTFDRTPRFQIYGFESDDPECFLNGKYGSMLRAMSNPWRFALLLDDGTVQEIPFEHVHDISRCVDDENGHLYINGIDDISLINDYTDNSEKRDIRSASISANTDEERSKEDYFTYEFAYASNSNIDSEEVTSYTSNPLMATKSSHSESYNNSDLHYPLSTTKSVSKQNDSNPMNDRPYEAQALCNANSHDDSKNTYNLTNEPSHIADDAITTVTTTVTIKGNSSILGRYRI